MIGTIENIEGFTRDDLVRHVQQHYCGQDRRRRRRPLRRGSLDAPCRRIFGAMLASPGGAVSHPPEPAPHAGQAVARRFAQVRRCSCISPTRSAPQAPNATHRNAGAWPRRSPPTCSAAACPRRGWTRCANGWAGLHGRRHHRQRRRMAQLRGACSDHAGQGRSTGPCHRRTAAGPAMAIDPVHLERAKNQLTVSRVRAAERPSPRWSERWKSFSRMAP